MKPERMRPRIERRGPGAPRVYFSRRKREVRGAAKASGLRNAIAPPRADNYDRACVTARSGSRNPPQAVGPDLGRRPVALELGALEIGAGRRLEQHNPDVGT